MVNEFSDNENDYLLLKTPRNNEFRVNLNSNNNLSLFTTKNINKQGTLTKSKLLKHLNGEKAFDGWEGYANSIINYLKSNHNLVSKIELEPKKYVLIIDEINRGNVSGIFGELITLMKQIKEQVKKKLSVLFFLIQKKDSLCQIISILLEQ